VWPGQDLIDHGYFFPDPCECDPMVEHFSEGEGGKLMPITKAGAFALDLLRLNREACIRFRKRRMAIHGRIVYCRTCLDTIIAPAEMRTLLERILQELEVEWAECYACELRG
jgi:hypothetical protein